MNPIHRDSRGWFFWDEVWAYEHGPFESRELAEKALKEYVESLNAPAPKMVLEEGWGDLKPLEKVKRGQ